VAPARISLGIALLEACSGFNSTSRMLSPFSLKKSVTSLVLGLQSDFATATAFEASIE